ncbi:hypothetical protein BKA00_002478 [Actinomadura coerulea]|uniref:Lrp/AsnC family transcriptional regulator n=1 Tax=Actinomadura coerulea TaxID=46159 RepID=A0A7X0FXW9_9ACTN|nr:hypothetical protein [Actinomadura coerulea]MBB6395564.1 hypothetical protein [Actinomadura coerulea]GGQ25402.1 hypothetical protein GCM10010187_47400 [Actinomadura coerulea]
MAGVAEPAVGDASQFIRAERRHQVVERVERRRLVAGGSHQQFDVVGARARDEDALYTYLSDRIGSPDGVERVETNPITSYIKCVAPTS